MTVVSNTSPIINLAAIGRLDLIQRLYSRITIPQAVFHEITVIGAGEPGAREVEQSDWISCVTVADRNLIISLSAELDPGEAEAIACAVELNAPLLLIDERGIPGVLVEAKHRGLIDAVKPLLDDLIAHAGFWLRNDLYTQVLRAAGEDPPDSG